MEDTAQQVPKQVQTKHYRIGRNNYPPQQVRFTVAVRYVFERGMLSRIYQSISLEHQQVRPCSDVFVSVSEVGVVGVVGVVEIASLPHIAQS